MRVSGQQLLTSQRGYWCGDDGLTEVLLKFLQLAAIICINLLHCRSPVKVHAGLSVGNESVCSDFLVFRLCALRPCIIRDATVQAE